MREQKYSYKGFDIMNRNKTDKIKNEYFNPYGYNIYSSAKDEADDIYSVTHTNQSDKRK